MKHLMNVKLRQHNRTEGTSCVTDSKRFLGSHCFFISWVCTGDFLSCYPQDAHFYFNHSILHYKTNFVFVCSKVIEPAFLD